MNLKLLKNKILYLFLCSSLIAPYSAWAVTNINTCSDLINIQKNLSGQYVLAQDIDCNGYSVTPIGTINKPFTGTFNGNNHYINNLSISLKSTDYVGLFGVTDGATISNVKLNIHTILGESFVGGLVGLGKNTTIDSVGIDGNQRQTFVCGICGTSGKDSNGNPYESLGGLAGALSNSIVTNSYSQSIDVWSPGSGSSPTVYYNYIGGLVGKIENTTVSKSYAIVLPTIAGSTSVGGLIGKMLNSTIKQSYSTNSTINPNYYSVGHTAYNLGGLIGEMDNTSGGNSLVTESFSYSSVISSGTAGNVLNSGGLIGYVNSTATSCDDPKSSARIENSYSTSKVNGEQNIGGLIGQIVGSATLENNYSVGTLYSTQYIPAPPGFGGLVGYLLAKYTVCTTSSYWNTDTEEGDGSPGGVGVGVTSNQMYKKNTYVNWDFTNIWNMPSNSYPCLRGLNYC